MQKVNLRYKYQNKCHLKKTAKSCHGWDQQLHSLLHKKHVEHGPGKDLCFFKVKTPWKSQRILYINPKCGSLEKKHVQQSSLSSQVIELVIDCLPQGHSGITLFCHVQTEKLHNNWWKRHQLLIIQIIRISGELKT